MICWKCCTLFISEGHAQIWKQRNSAMRDQKRSENMYNHHRSGRQSKYDKEMNHAFTLIFHNIKRLQDGHLCNTSSKPIASDEAEMSPASTLMLPLQRPRASSDPSNGLAEGHVRHGIAMDASGIRPKSQSFTCEASPSSRRRKVTFADDYTTKAPLQRSDLTRQTAAVKPLNTYCLKWKAIHSQFDLMKLF